MISSISALTPATACSGTGGATADTRVVVPTAQAALRLELDRLEQSIGSPVGFDVYASELDGRPLAGASVTMGLQNMLPHYLNRLGMEVSWAGRFGVILLVLLFTFPGGIVGGVGAGWKYLQRRAGSNPGA